MKVGELLYSGKAKSLYYSDDQNMVVAEFRDDITAFDGEKKENLSQKGVANNYINAYLMGMLSAKDIPTHFIKKLSDSKSLFKRLKMIPVECVVRNIAAGSICRRLGATPGLVFDPPLYELFLKNDALHDPLITENHALTFGWATQAQLDQMKILSLKINEILKNRFDQANMILVDAKYEFGIAGEKLYLGDEISPDSCRIWDKNTREILDKDRFRKDLGQVVKYYIEIGKRLQISFPQY